jgi:hypothetical protein
MELTKVQAPALMVGLQKSTELIRKQFTPEEIREMGLAITDNLLKIADHQEVLEEAKAVAKLKMTPLKDENTALLGDIRRGFRDEEKEVYLNPDYDNRIMEIFDLEGNKIAERRMLMSEYQLRLL